MSERRSVDPMLQNAGQRLGLEIWRINRFALEKVAPEYYGSFYTGDSYIVLNVVAFTGSHFQTKGRSSWDVHFWLGKETTPDEKCTAAMKTVELDDALNGGPVQYREVQGHESALFLSYFKGGIKYLNGGVQSGMRHVSEPFQSWKPKLFQCKGKRIVRCTQVECDFKNLNLGDVFILDCGKKVYVWMPPESGNIERIRYIFVLILKGMEQARSICNGERAGRAEVEALDQDWDVNEEFWNIFGGNGNVSKISSAAKGGSDEDYWNTDVKQLRLFRVCDKGGFKITVEAQGKFGAEQLDSNDAFILDTVNGGIFVWIGKNCTWNERKKAMEWADKYLSEEGRPSWTRVTRVLDGAEPVIFTQWAQSWNKKVDGHTVTRPKFEPKLYHCSDESGKFMVEEVANFTCDDLDGDDVMILDALENVYVWIGRGASPNEVTRGISNAERYLKSALIPRPTTAKVITIVQGGECNEFKKCFKTWKSK
uniref:Gelsolin n=1 Tax=Syphacia muris TaxID=451379 RepID=A0A0N5AZI4_9BILA